MVRNGECGVVVDEKMLLGNLILIISPSDMMEKCIPVQID